MIRQPIVSASRPPPHQLSIHNPTQPRRMALLMDCPLDRWRTPYSDRTAAKTNARCPEPDNHIDITTCRRVHDQNLHLLHFIVCNKHFLGSPQDIRTRQKTIGHQRTAHDHEKKTWLGRNIVRSPDVTQSLLRRDHWERFANSLLR